MDDEREPVRGLVRRGSTATEFRRGIWPVPAALVPWVETLWTVDWDRDDQPPLMSSVISYPAVNLTAEWGSDRERHGHRLPATLVHGVVTEVFRVDISGRGGVVGAKFRPDGFAAWSGLDASALTDLVLEAGDVLGPSYAELHLDVQDLAEPADRVAVLTEALLRDAPRTLPPARRRLSDLVDRVAADETLTRVDQLVDVSGWTMRTLQRRFRRDVGVSPKWVLARFRLQQAALALERDPDVDLATLAVRLGWYDQAHLTNDFGRMLGETPGEYAARSRSLAPA